MAASSALGVKFVSNAGGTADFVYSSAVVGYQAPNQYPMVDGKTYRYRAESADLSQWEFGTGIYTASTQTITRATIGFSSSGSKVSFTNPPQIGITLFPADFLSFTDAQTFTSTEKDQASQNLGTVRAIRTQKFTSSATYTPDPNLLYAIIEGVGGGAGGGGATAGATAIASGGGGGGGAYSRSTVTAATIGASKAVVIGTAGAAGAGANGNGGAGGQTSVGSTLCVAPGGSGGINGGSGSASGGSGGAAGTPPTANDLAATGGPGGWGFGFTSAATVATGGAGGSSIWGGGGIGGAGLGSSPGSAGTGYGGGGGGGASYNSSAAAGGAGAAGAVLITEYCSK